MPLAPRATPSSSRAMPTEADNRPLSVEHLTTTQLKAVLRAKSLDVEPGADRNSLIGSLNAHGIKELAAHEVPKS